MVQCLMSVFGWIKSWCRPKQVDTYSKSLRNRYRAIRFESTNALREAADCVGKFADSLKSEIEGATEPVNSNVVLTKAMRLEELSVDMKRTAVTWPSDTLIVTDAIEYVRNSLAVQVSKAGGLLTFNGLLAAIATLRHGNITPLLAVFILPLTISSLCALVTIFVVWTPEELLLKPEEHLNWSLRLEAIRAFLLNWAVIFSGITIIVGVPWLLCTK